MNAEIESAERALYAAAEKLGRLASSTPMAQRRGVEARYGHAYQALVKLGARPQLKRKYRYGL